MGEVIIDYVVNNLFEKVSQVCGMPSKPFVDFTVRRVRCILYKSSRDKILYKMNNSV